MHNYSCRGGFLKRMLEIGQKIASKGFFYKGQARNHSTKKSDQSNRNCSYIEQCEDLYKQMINGHFNPLYRLSKTDSLSEGQRKDILRELKNVFRERNQILDSVHQLIEHYSDPKKIPEKNSDQIIPGAS